MQMQTDQGQGFAIDPCSDLRSKPGSRYIDPEGTLGKETPAHKSDRLKFSLACVINRLASSRVPN